MTTGKEFEELIVWRARKYDEPAGLYMLNRYGVMSSFVDGQFVPVQSYPDFEMIIKGYQYVFDVKTCSQASYDLTGGISKSFTHQYPFMKKKAKFGAVCFVLLHFNERKTKRLKQDAATYLLRIPSELWDQYDTGELKHISRTAAERYGIKVEWDIPENSKARILTPNIYKALLDNNMVVKT